MDDLSGRVALVTGGDRGIGRAIALALGRAGAAIGVHYHSHAEDAAAVCAELDRLGRRGVAVQADLATATDAATLVQAVERELGGVEILVNNAGIAEPRTLEELTEADWDRHIAVNLKAAFLLTQAVI